MTRWIYAICAIALTAAAIYGGFGLTRHVIVAVDKWGDSAPDLKPTLDAISGPRGTLWQVDKAVVKMGDAVVTTQLQERAIAPATIAAVNSLATIAPHANLTMDSASRTLDAGTQTLQGASDTLRTINDKAGPLMDAYTQSGTDLDTLLRNNAITQTLTNVQGMTSSGAGILADGRTVADKSTADYLKAHTKWGTVGARLWGGYDILSWAAEHRP
jgi:uncharacterized protein YoxC